MNTAQIQSRMGKENIVKLKEMAENQGTTFSMFCRSILIDYLNKNHPKKASPEPFPVPPLAKTNKIIKHEEAKDVLNKKRISRRKKVEVTNEN